MRVLFLAALLLSLGCVEPTTQPVTAVLTTAGRPGYDVYASTSSEVMTEACLDLDRADTAAIQRLYESGRIVPIAAGTHVLVLDQGKYQREVQILEGARKGEHWYVPVFAIKYAP